jgi:ribosomal protein S6--L-glutamate ligase
VNIGILSRNRNLYSTRRLAQSARMRGHSARVIDTLQVPVKIGVRKGEVSGPQLPPVDAIIPRIGTSITFYGLAVVRQFESIGVLTTAPSSAIAKSRDKLHSLQMMSKSGIAIPKTTVVTDPLEIWPAIQIAGGLPVIIKLIRGTQGRGVYLATEMKTVITILNTVHRLREQVLVQEFIEESRGTDIRIIVVGNRCVAAMRRTAATGDFRSNLHRGGSAEPVTLDLASRQLATKAAHAHGLGVAGVDIVLSRRGPLVLEVNSSPGLEGIETSTREDVAGEIIRYLEREEKRRKHKRRQQRKRA